MKFFITPALQATPITSILNNIGISNTTDIGQEGVTGFVLSRNPEVRIPINGVNQLTQYINTFKLNTANFLNAHYNIAGSHDLNNRWKMHEALVTSGCSFLNTIFPTTEQEMVDFFNQHGQVFVKPTFAGCIESNGSLREMLEGAVNVEENEFNEIVSSIPTPSTIDHFYKLYDSYEEFTADVDVAEFLNIQNSPNALPIHQCILQENFADVNHTFTYSTVTGYVNGSGQIIFDPVTIATRKCVRNDQRGRTTIMYTNFNEYTSQDVIDTLNNRVVQGQQTDNYNVENIIRNVLSQSDTKNTYFTIQACLVNGVWIPYDVMTGRLLSSLRRKWLTNEQHLARLQFMNDLPHDATKLIDDTYKFWFEIDVLGGITLSQIASAASLNIAFAVPVREGMRVVQCVAYGDNAVQVASNFRTFMDLCNPPS